MSRSLRILFSSAVILLGIAAIFFFSDQSGTVSHNSSKKVAEGVAEGITNMSSTRTYTERDISFLSEVLEYPLRKLAHLFIYFVLGLLVYTGLRFVLMDKMRPGYAFIAILLVFLVACADEINQYFSGGRGASFGDVILDTVGGTLGMYFFHIVKDFVAHIRALFQNRPTGT